jgi:hypothetical protein
MISIFSIERIKSYRNNNINNIIVHIMNFKEFESKLFAVYKPKGIYSTKYLNSIKKLLSEQLGYKIKIGHGVLWILMHLVFLS